MHHGISEMCETMQSYAEMLCHEVAQKIERKLATIDGIDPASTAELISLCEPGDRFTTLKSRHLREKYYESTDSNYCYLGRREGVESTREQANT